MGDSSCRKVVEVVWSSPHQGLTILIERYRNARVMHPSVPDLYKPALFQNGVRWVFHLPPSMCGLPCNVSDVRCESSCCYFRNTLHVFVTGAGNVPTIWC